MQELNYEGIYSYRFKESSSEERRRTWQIIAHWIYRFFGNPERVLDPAAGQLEFISEVPSAEAWAVDKYQPAPQNRKSNLHYIQADIFEADLPENYFDLVFASNFLEHLESPERLHELLLRMKRILKPGGRIAIIGPNFKYCYREYFDCSDHRLALSHLSIEEFLFAAGFGIEKSYPLFLPYSFRSRIPKAGWLVKLYLALPWIWRFFGKQYFVIGVRKN